MTSQQIDLKDRIKDEYKKCLANPEYFIRTYCKIQHPKKGRIPFDLFKYQGQTIRDFDINSYNIILKGRQIGISTVVACYALWLMLFHRDKNVLVIATKQDTAKNLITKVHFAFDNLPVYLKVECIEDNKLSLKFKNGSHIKAATAAADSGRSEALSLLILDEAAFIKNAENIWLAALPTLSTGGQAVLISTPNGMGNFFHKTYSSAIQELVEQKPTSDGTEPTEMFKFHPIKLDWRVHPERDQAWRDGMGKLQGEKFARQEYDAEFIGSGNTVIDGDLIELYAKDIKEPKIKSGFDGNLWIWDEPDYNRQYMVVADVARGDGTDFSACHVIDIESCTQVAEYKGKLSTKQYGHFLVELATKYNDALLVIERENVGWDTIQTAIDRNYQKLFYMSKDRKIVDIHKTVNNRYRTDDKQMVPGFGTTISTRPLIINKIDMYMRDIESKAITIRSLRLIEELRVFIWHNGKAQAQDGYNDDLVIPLGIALWVRDVALKLHQEGIEQTKGMLGSIKRTGGVDETTAPPAVYMPGHLGGYDPWKMPLQKDNLGRGPMEDEDLRWLL